MRAPVDGVSEVVELRSVDLLDIDVTSELRNLSQGQLQGSWQIPAEVVRGALRRGAASVDVRFGRRSFAIRARGAAVPAGELEAFRATLDPAVGAVRQHRAIVALESAGANDLLGLAGLEDALVVVDSQDNGELLTVGRRHGRAAGVDRQTVAATSREFSVRFGGGGIDLRAASSWLSAVCRFAPGPVTVNGRVLDGRVPGGIFRMRLARPLPGRVWISQAGDAPRLWLLQHGVVAARAMVPGYPAFQAVVELGGERPEPATSAALREAVTPYLPEIIDQATAMMVRLGARLPGLDERSRQRVSVLLLRSALNGLRRDEIEGLAMVHARTRAREDSWIRPDQVAELARGGVVGRLSPQQDPDRHLLPAAGAVVLSAEEGELLAELVGVTFEQVPPRVRTWFGRRWGRRLLRALRAAGGGVLDVVRRRKLVGWERLTGPEQQLVERLRSSWAEEDGGQIEVLFCSGSAPVRPPRGRPPRLVLARANPLVRAATRALARDTSWTYPVLLALLGPEWTPPAWVRERWLHRSS